MKSRPPGGPSRSGAALPPPRPFPVSHAAPPPPPPPLTRGKGGAVTGEMLLGAGTAAALRELGVESALDVARLRGHTAKYRAYAERSVASASALLHAHLGSPRRGTLSLPKGGGTLELETRMAGLLKAGAAGRGSRVLCEGDFLKCGGVGRGVLRVRLTALRQGCRRRGMGRRTTRCGASCCWIRGCCGRPSSRAGRRWRRTG